MNNKHSMYSSLQVANTLIEISKKKDKALTSIALLQILYLIQAASSIEHPNGFIEEPFKAWNYGPMLPSFYEKHLKKLGINPIGESFGDGDAVTNPSDRALIGAVYQECFALPALDLMLYTQGEAWKTTPKGALIPHQAIQIEFIQNKKIVQKEGKLDLSACQASYAKAEESQKMTLDRLKKTYLTSIDQEIRSLKDEKDLDKRKIMGGLFNSYKKLLQQDLYERYQNLVIITKNTAIDVSLPSIHSLGRGKLHPITQAIIEIEEFFTQQQFQFMDCPEIDDEYHNFTALNIPPEHPARAMHDTFYLKDTPLLLRTHCSTVQIHAMEQHEPPFKMMHIGKVYRRDFDTTHIPSFHQVDGIIIDQNSNLMALKSLMVNFLHFFFNQDIQYRFRVSFFPFTEPSLELDIACFCHNQGACSICHGERWIEILGCGCVHHKIFKHCQKENLSGIAFAYGIERLVMIKHKIPDIRSLFQNNIRFLRQF